MGLHGRPLRVIVPGGGTGGHVFPLVATVRELRLRTERGLDVLWIGAAGSLEARTAAAEGIAFASVATGKLRRAANPLRMLNAANVKDMARVPLGTRMRVNILTAAVTFSPAMANSF